MAAELTIEIAEKKAPASADEGNPSLLHGSEEAVDWDVAIDVAPERPAGTLRVTLEFGGRDKPVPADDPWAE